MAMGVYGQPTPGTGVGQQAAQGAGGFRRMLRKALQGAGVSPDGAAPSPTVQQAAPKPAAAGAQVQSAGNGGGHVQQADPETIAKWGARRQYKTGSKFLPIMWQQVKQLQAQANTNAWDPLHQANYLAPRVEELERIQANAGQADAAALAQNGLSGDGTSSSYGAAVAGARSAAGSTGRAQIVNAMAQQQDQQQQTAQQLLMQFSAAQAAGNLRAAQDAMFQLAQLQMQQEQLEAQSGFDWAGLIGAVGGAAGMAGGLGWAPFAAQAAAGVK